MEYIIDGTRMHTREAAHEEIAAVMEFPDFYGKNLDALWDMLTSTRGEAVITGVSTMLNALGGYGCRIVKTFYDAAEENRYFEFRVEG